jgi:hypothetical protein
VVYRNREVCVSPLPFGLGGEPVIVLINQQKMRHLFIKKCNKWTLGVTTVKTEETAIMSKGDAAIVLIMCAILFGTMVHDFLVVDGCLDGSGRWHERSGTCEGSLF